LKTAIITISKQGLSTAERIISELEFSPTLYVFEKVKQYISDSTKDSFDKIYYFPQPLQQLVRNIFKDFSGLIFVMATGIVIRVIAPLINDKYTDPAIVVVDDVGRYAISMLSGHEGRANTLTYKIAGILHTNAVITTGTEAQKDIIVGVGCKKGVAADSVKTSIINALSQINLKPDDVRMLSTIDIKAKEQGLLQASESLGIPLNIVSLRESATCIKEYSKSGFVNEKIGVGGVCEPAALISGRKTQLILTKQKYEGVTIAIARENFMW